jgi:RNA polymerase sigma-70 factor (ECF subfamily)
MDNDLSLVRFAQQGDKRAFTLLVEKYEQRVYNLARKLMRDQQDAEDVLQETFISVYKHLGTFRGDSSFSTWLYRIATNASLMKLRGRKVPSLSLDEPSESFDGGEMPREIADWEFTPEQALLRGELRYQMDLAVQTLPESLRTVFVLRDVEGLSVQETADVLNISTPNVKTRLHRARLVLREALAFYFKEHASTNEGISK